MLGWVYMILQIVPYLLVGYVYLWTINCLKSRIQLYESFHVSQFAGSRKMFLNATSKAVCSNAFRGTLRMLILEKQRLMAIHAFTFSWHLIPTNFKTLWKLCPDRKHFASRNFHLFHINSINFASHWGNNSIKFPASSNCHFSVLKDRNLFSINLFPKIFNFLHPLFKQLQNHVFCVEWHFVQLGSHVQSLFLRLFPRKWRHIVARRYLIFDDITFTYDRFYTSLERGVHAWETFVTLT